MARTCPEGSVTLPLPLREAGMVEVGDQERNEACRRRPTQRTHQGRIGVHSDDVSSHLGFSVPTLNY